MDEVKYVGMVIVVVVNSYSNSSLKIWCCGIVLCHSLVVVEEVVVRHS